MKQIVNTGLTVRSPIVPAVSIPDGATGVGGASSPGSGGAATLGAGVSPGASEGAGPPPPELGIGCTSAPTTSGGVPPGGKPHIAVTRPPPNDVANASTIEAGHQSPWYPACGRPSGSIT